MGSFLGSSSSQWTRGFWCLLSQPLRCSFVESVGNELEGLVLIAWGQKITFLQGQPPPPLLLYWCGDTEKGHLGGGSSLYDSPFLLWSGLCAGVCTDTRGTDASQGPSLGSILGNYSGKSSKGLGGKELAINLGCHQGLRLVHLHPASVVEPGGMNKAPMLVRDRLNLTKEGKASVESLSTSPSRAGKDASGGKEPQLWMLHFFSFTDWS